MNRTTKQDRILRHLEEFGSITSLEAFQNYGVTRLSAIIFNLKKEGYVFEDKIINFIDRYNCTTHFKQYVLIGWEDN